MGEKDISEKYLLAYEDVFTDVYNVLFFAADIIQQEYLRRDGNETIYKVGNKSRIQQRDVVKEYVKDGKILCVLGIENQTDEDVDMPIRVMGYDYGDYREMLDHEKQIVPVVTIVLNFGEKRWKKGKSLKELVKNVPEEIKSRMQDYQIQVYDVAYLPESTRKCFTSDFKIVADFFAERNREDYKPSMEKIEHGEAVLELIAIFTKDTRYQEIQEEVKNMVEEGREVSMCVFAERMERRGIEKGEKLGIKLGIEKGEKLGIKKGEKLGIKKGEKLGILQVAERMLKGNKPYQEIEMYTGLSAEELKKLAEQQWL